MPDTITAYFYNQGILGIIILVLGFVVGYLFRDGRQRERASNEEIKAIQEARIQDLKQTKDQIVGPLQELQQTLDNLAYIVKRNNTTSS